MVAGHRFVIAASPGPAPAAGMGPRCANSRDPSVSSGRIATSAHPVQPPGEARARMPGRRRIFFLDDDVRDARPADVHRTLSMFGSYPTATYPAG